MRHRARFFVLVTFLKNPEKNKDYNKCCLPFQPIFACGALAASISVGIVIPSTWFVYLYKQTVSITVVVLSTVIKSGTTAQIE